jgi:hypothetical protein
LAVKVERLRSLLSIGAKRAVGYFKELFRQVNVTGCGCKCVVSGCLMTEMGSENFTDENRSEFKLQAADERRSHQRGKLKLELRTFLGEELWTQSGKMFATEFGCYFGVPVSRWWQ